MNIISLAIIVLFLIWLIALIITGSLSLKYSQKHKPFMKIREEYQKEWNEIKASMSEEELLLPIDIEYNLPEGEEVYFVLNNVFIYEINKNTKDFKKFSKLNDSKLGFDEWDMAILKKNYQLLDDSFKKTEHITINFYITNKRIMIENKTDNSFQQVLLSNVKRGYVSIINKATNYYKGVIIQTIDKNYEIITDKPEVILTINAIIKNKKGE